VASIERRATRTTRGSVKYRVRFRDPAGEPKNRSFDTLTAAKAFAATVEADKLRGSYVDQSRGRMTLGEYAESWLDVQTFGESTREQTTLRVRKHIIPALGSTPLMGLRGSQIQSWVRSKQKELSPRTVRLIFSVLSSILSAAVDDERIAKNPCAVASRRLPRLDERRIVPWTEVQVAALQRGLPDGTRSCCG